MVPAPTNDLQVGEVRLPKLVGRGGLVAERVGGLDDDIGRAGDQILSLEQPVDSGFRDEVAPLVGEAHRQLTRAEFRLLQGQGNDLLADLRR